jgi:hypothetical protein
LKKLPWLIAVILCVASLAGGAGVNELPRHGSAEQKAHAAEMIRAGVVKLDDVAAAAKPRPIVRAATIGTAFTCLTQAQFDTARAAARPGDVIQLGCKVSAPQFTVNGWSIVGITPDAEIDWQLPKGTTRTPEQKCFGLIIGSGSNANVVTGVKLRSNNGIVWINGGTSGVRFVANDLSWGWDHSFYSGLGFWAGQGANGLVIDWNLFHDAWSSDRNLEIWGWSNGSYSYNTFKDVHDGGHVMECGGNLRFTNNYATGLGRMMLEVQGDGATNSLILENNAAFNWHLPYYDCDFLSICPVNMTGVSVRNNYARNDFTGAWGVDDARQGNRFGIAIECMYGDGICENNTIGGPNPWAAVVAAGTVNTKVRNNVFYGTTLWGDYVGEPGVRGNGTVQDLGGNVKKPFAQMPPPPAPPSTQQSTTKPADPTIATPASLVLSDRDAAFAFPAPSAIPGATSAGLQFISTSGHELLGRVPVPLTATSAIVTNIHPGWHVDVELVVAVNSTQSFESAPATIFMPAQVGTWDATSRPSIKSDPTTQPSTEDPAVGVDVRLKSGKVQSFTPKAAQP